MTFLRLLRDGFRAATRHKRLVLVAYLLPLLPALLLALMARATLAPALDFSLFAARVLDGSWFGVWRDFAASPANHLPVVLGTGYSLAILLTMLLQIPVAAGIVEVMLAGDLADRTTFFAGVATHTGRFVRSAVWFAITASLAGAAAGGVAAGFFKLAENRGDARFDLIGMAAAALTAFLLLALLDPAYDLSRIAAARYGDRKTLRGFRRALWAVLRHPLIFLPLYLSYAILIVAVHLVYYLGRRPFTASTALAIAAVFVAQQLVMLLSAYFQIAFWGASVAAYHTLGETRYCEKKLRRPFVMDEPAAPHGRVPAEEPAPAPEPESPASGGLAAPVDDVFAPTTER